MPVENYVLEVWKCTKNVQTRIPVPQGCLVVLTSPSALVEYMRSQLGEEYLLVLLRNGRSAMNEEEPPFQPDEEVTVVVGIPEGLEGEEVSQICATVEQFATASEYGGPRFQIVVQVAVWQGEIHRSAEDHLSALYDFWAGSQIRSVLLSVDEDTEAHWMMDVSAEADDMSIGDIAEEAEESVRLMLIIK